MRFNNHLLRKDHIRPYLLMAIAAVLAYLPVSSMLFTLKNDVLAIEYPVRHFMSEAIRNGESPLWFNTWCFGFPLQSILTWGSFSTTAMLSALLPSGIVTLHVCFLLFVILSGWVMYRLLIRHFLSSGNIALLLSCCYMLSGFTVSSSQWLLYITGMVFIPLVLHCSLKLLKKPSWRNSFLLGLSWFLLLTNVHIYLTVFTAYFFVFFFAIALVRSLLDKNRSKGEKRKLIFFVFTGAILVVLLCFAPVYYTAETIAYLERSHPLMEDSAFFRSNYFHPEGFKSLLLPLSTVKTTHFNTEGSILDIYIGLLPLLLFPVSLVLNLKQKNRRAWLLLSISIFFLVLSLGHLTPLREWLNNLPGLSYFRHPGVLRIFFTMAFIIYLAQSFRNFKVNELLALGTTERKYIIYTLSFLSIISLIVLIAHARSFSGIYKGSISETVRSINDGQLVLVNSIIQLIFCLLLLLAAVKRPKHFPTLLIAELVINFLICTPFYAVSSYSVKTVNQVMEIKKGFPVQSTYPYDVPAEIQGENETIWRNTNTFKKEVSVNVSMPGPLILEQVHLFLMSPEKEKLKNKALAFINDSTAVGSIKITEQKPASVKMDVDIDKPSVIVLQQAYFPGWKAYHNGKAIALIKNEYPFVSVNVPSGKGELQFRFEKKGVVYTSLLLHAVSLLGLLGLAYRKLFTRSASPS